MYLDNAYCDGSEGTRTVIQDTETGGETTRGCKEPTFNKALQDSGDEQSPMVDGFAALKAKGVKYVAPPMQILLKKDGSGFAPSDYAKAAKAADMNIITWTLERSGPLGRGGGWYYRTVKSNVNNDGDMLEVLHVLNTRVGIEGIFSDWPATATFYANCIISTTTCVDPAVSSHLSLKPSTAATNSGISGDFTLMMTMTMTMFAALLAHY